jgi:hypothetical protein
MRDLEIANARMNKLQVGSPGQGGSNTGNHEQGLPTAPSSSTILSNPVIQPGPLDPTNIFGGSDFTPGSMPTFDAFEDSLKGGFDVDFERDFGEWFNPAPEDDVTDGAPGLNGFPPGGGMSNMGNNLGMNMQPQIGGQPMGGPQMTPHGMTAAQQHQQVNLSLNSTIINPVLTHCSG